MPCSTGGGTSSWRGTEAVTCGVVTGLPATGPGEIAGEIGLVSLATVPSVSGSGVR